MCLTFQMNIAIIPHSTKKKIVDSVHTVLGNQTLYRINVNLTWPL